MDIDERIEYAAKGLFTGAYRGGGDIDGIESVRINQEYCYCQLKMYFTSGIMKFDKIDASDVIEIAEAIASVKKMQRNGNRWDA